MHITGYYTHCADAFLKQFPSALKAFGKRGAQCFYRSKVQTRQMSAESAES